MTERERLLELLENGFYEALSKCKGEDKDKKACDFLADYLLENGVIVPIVKEGDTRYAIAYTADTRVIEVRITEINRDGSVIRIESVANPLHFWFLDSKEFYKWSNFKTREEAEKTLEERKSKNETR